MPYQRNAVASAHQQETVLTIACSGTAYDNNLCEIVAEFSKGIVGTPFDHHHSSNAHWDHMHLYGVGSEGLTKQHTPIADANQSSSFMTKMRRGWDILSGGSMYSNIEKAYSAIKKRIGKENTAAEFTVNLFGWSRGAVTTVGIANKIAKKYPNAKINLFLIDPVPGAGNKKAELLTIPEQVKSLTVTYAQGETKYNPLRFKALTPADFNINDPQKTTVQVIRTPGLHFSAVEHVWATNQAEPTVVWNSLHRFLTDHQVTLDQSKIHQHKVVDDQAGIASYELPGDHELLEAWNSITADVASQRGQVYTADGQLLKPFATDLPFCQCQDHEDLFRKTCPLLVNLISRDKMLNDHEKLQPIWEELEALSAHGCHTTLNILSQHFEKNSVFRAASRNDAINKKIQDCLVKANIPAQAISDYQFLEAQSNAVLQTKDSRFNSPMKTLFADADDSSKMFSMICPELKTYLLRDGSKNNNLPLKPLWDELDNLAVQGCQKTLLLLSRHVKDNPIFTNHDRNKLMDKKIQECLLAANKSPMMAIKFTPTFNAVWLRSMEQPGVKVPLSNILSLCHTYVSSWSLNRHHKEFFKELARQCQDPRKTAPEIKVYVNAYLNENEENMNKQGHGYSTCQYILSQLKLVELRMAAEEKAASSARMSPF